MKLARFNIIFSEFIMTGTCPGKPFIYLRVTAGIVFCKSSLEYRLEIKDSGIDCITYFLTSRRRTLWFGQNNRSRVIIIDTYVEHNSISYNVHDCRFPNTIRRSSFDFYHLRHSITLWYQIIRFRLRFVSNNDDW